MTTKRRFTADVTHEPPWFVAQCREVDMASQGETEQAALDGLREALTLLLEDGDSVPTVDVGAA